MKKISLVTALMLLAVISTKATIWTVSNNTIDSSAADYSSLQTAIDNATEGDTLYISGSLTSYGNVTLNKKLVLIGAGYNSSNFKHLSTSCTISPYYRKDNFNNVVGSCAGSVFIGIDIEIRTSGSNGGIDNLVFKRCKVDAEYVGGSSTNYVSGWMFINNYIVACKPAYSSFDWAKDFTFIGNICEAQMNFYSNHATNITLINNTFINSQVGGKYCTVKNNIFYGTTITNKFINSTMYNNLYYGSSSNSFNFSTTNTLSGNIENQDPKFVDLSGSTVNFSYSNDYHLQSTSPARNAGTDGTDLGVYGGTYPFPSGGDIPYQTSAMPNIPQIMNIQISNPVIPIDSVLHINVKARIHD
jgi:hypothetical protein